VCPVAAQRALGRLLAIDQSFYRLLELGNTRCNGVAPGLADRKARAKSVLLTEKGEEEPGANGCFSLLRPRQPRCPTARAAEGLELSGRSRRYL
jgi:hypothetical protein